MEIDQVFEWGGLPVSGWVEAGAMSTACQWQHSACLKPNNGLLLDSQQTPIRIIVFDHMLNGFLDLALSHTAVYIRSFMHVLEPTYFT